MTEYQGPERRRGGPDRRTQSFERVRILIVDDHALFRVGIRGILAAGAGPRDRGRGGRPADARSTPPSPPTPTSS